jgi:hypothetical protein
MKRISPTQHGYLDYLTVVLFLFGPIIGLTGLPATLAFVLAGVHLAMTLSTDFSYGAIKLIPYRIHGWVERVVGPIVILLPFIFNFESTARGFYILVGIVIILVGLITDYNQTEEV